MNYDFIDKWPSVRVLVAGEVGIDEYIWGETRRISPEAPVPVVEVDSKNEKLGMAANVAQNIVSLGGRTSLLTITGDDRDAERLQDQLAASGILQTTLLRDNSRPTLRKVRILAQKQHVVRVDYERSHQLSADIAKKFVGALDELIDGVDGIIVQDYGKGIWSSDTMQFVVRAREKGKPVFVDPSRNARLGVYRGATLLTPNLVEAEALVGAAPAASKKEAVGETRLNSMADAILERTDADHAVITCGEFGMAAKSKGSGELVQIPTFAREVYDVTGAGDTVIAVFALSMLAGASLPEAMRIANAAAGLVVGHVGTASVSMQELKDELERLRSVGLFQSSNWRIV